MLKAGDTEESAPRTMKEIIQKKFIEEIIECACKFKLDYFLKN